MLSMRTTPVLIALSAFFLGGFYNEVKDEFKANRASIQNLEKIVGFLSKDMQSLKKLEEHDLPSINKKLILHESILRAVTTGSKGLFSPDVEDLINQFLKDISIRPKIITFSRWNENQSDPLDQRA